MIERSHYLSEEAFVALQRQTHGEAPTTTLHALVAQQCGIVYRRGSEEQQLQAALLHVSHLALSDRFAAARDREHGGVMGARHAVQRSGRSHGAHPPTELVPG